MKEKTLIKISFMVSIISITILYLISINSSFEQNPDTISINGTVQSIKVQNNITNIVLESICINEITIYDPIEISQGEYIKIFGEKINKKIKVKLIET